MASTTSETEKTVLNKDIGGKELINTKASNVGRPKGKGKSKGKDISQKKENAVPFDLFTQGTGRPRRSVSKPEFFQHPLELPKKKVSIEKIEIEVGEKPDNIKPILRKSAKTKPPTNLKSIKFFNKCAIQVIDPLKGWKDGVVRMPEDSDDNENKETRPLRSADDLRLTPESMRRLLSCDQADDLKPLSFNIYCEEIEEITIINSEKEDDHKEKEVDSFKKTKKVPKMEVKEGKKKNKTRKRSIVGDISLWAKKSKCSIDVEDNLRDDPTSDTLSSQCSSEYFPASDSYNSSSETRCSPEVTEEMQGSGDFKEDEPVEAIIELDSSTEDISGSFRDAVLLKDDISIREEVQKSLESGKDIRRTACLRREFDHAPFSSFNVLPAPFEVVVNDNWHLDFTKLRLSDERSPLSEDAKRKMRSQLHSLSQFPVLRKDRPISSVFASKAECTADVIDQFTAQEKKWYDHAYRCRQEAKSLPWSEALRPKTTDVWLGSVVQAETVKTFVKYWLKRGEKEEAEEKMKKKRLSYDCDSDYEDDFTDGCGANPLIIEGATGTGKSSLIAAIASELNCKLLEVNTGDFRNAASLRQKLSGAGESQRMLSNSISSFFTKSTAPKAKKQKTIIVVEDVDINFPKLDKDFYPTLKSLASESKVPVIWTCTKLPIDELRKEPSIPYQLVRLPKMEKATILNYSSVCVLALTDCYFKWKSLKNAFSRNNIRLDIRALLSELQFSMADTSAPLDMINREYPKYQRDLGYVPSSVYLDYDSFIEDKRQEHPAIIGSLMPFEDRSFSRKAELVRKLMESVNVFSFKDLTCDYLPILTQIDLYDSLKSKGSRRHLHYFSEVKGEYPIDRDGKLLENIRHFRLEKL
ncbi:unnamed protein product [Auanema sp. JU1783]|nr:unnamed protein product [Auanema sp. JU1783]